MCKGERGWLDVWFEVVRRADEAAAQVGLWFVFSFDVVVVTAFPPGARLQRCSALFHWVSCTVLALTFVEGKCDGVAASNPVRKGRWVSAGGKA